MCPSATRWPCPRRRLSMETTRSGWCRPISLWLLPSDRVSRPSMSTRGIPLTGKVSQQGAPITPSSCTWADWHEAIWPSFTLCMLMWTCFTHIHSYHLLSMTTLLPDDDVPVVTCHALSVWFQVQISCFWGGFTASMCLCCTQMFSLHLTAMAAEDQLCVKNLFVWGLL